MHLQMLSGKWPPLCLGLNVFIMYKKDILPKCFAEPRERHTTPTGGLHCINHHPGHHRMCCCMSDVARHVGPSIRITCRVIATKERKSINWNLSQYHKTTFQGIPTVNIRQPGDHLIENRALAFREWGCGIHHAAWDFYWNKRVLKWSTA